MFGGAALMSTFIRVGGPQLERDPKTGIDMVTTAAGNKLATFTDEAGNFFMVDRTGALWYDTGDPALGFYMVDNKGNMLNIFVDGAGNPQYVPVGNIKDLQSVEPKAIGGIDVKNLGKAFDKRRQLLVFPSEDGVEMPANAPATVGKDGTVQPPSLLEEGTLLLEEKQRWWPFGGSGSSGPDDIGGNFKRDLPS